MITDHAAVKVVLGAPNLIGQHARWWSEVYGSGIRHLEIFYRPWKKNQPADALSRQPTLPAPVDDGRSKEAQIATNISTLLQEDPNNVSSSDESICEQQLKDPALKLIMSDSYLSEGIYLMIHKWQQK